ncbi:hypothetical protein CK203_020708 [Vitis vinifera]|uniref:Uncharacterized protein n=1 Tax=Vitis vinifera TaxID=29760 RepID=A0A438FMU2_VITVI|nr:hypothetical protein CK203_020708 [Vitis vinifera]
MRQGSLGIHSLVTLNKAYLGVELEICLGLFRKLHPLVLNRDVEDVLSWKNSKKAPFLLDHSTAPSQEPLVILFLGVYLEVLGSNEGPALLNQRNLIGWHGAFVSKRKKKAWRVVSLCLMWTLWKERKERVFNDMNDSTKL